MERGSREWYEAASRNHDEAAAVLRERGEADRAARCEARSMTFGLAR